MTSTEYRLPRAVLPIDYDVNIDATPKRDAFNGHLVLSAKVVGKTTTLEMNARDLTVTNVTAKSGKKKLIGRATLEASRETVVLEFDEALPKGALRVELDFEGKLNPNMHGLYLAQDGSERAIVSQCEATDARAIFPCFDEPDLKATLKWTVRTDPKLVVVTNGKPKRIRRVKGRALHEFDRTRIIPTYLAAITIGDLDATKPVKVAGIPSRVLCGKGKLGQTGFAGEITRYVLPWYEDYFGHAYNFQKLDQVAVPGFDAGAMENVGAVFYRQNLLLMQPGATSWAAQKRIAEVVAHELAHQWFGNLVTMKWWDDLWLNEAFATWIAFKTVDLWKPEWRMWDDYLEHKEGALAADALVSTHPIYTPVKSPAEATELFDVITYEKGGSVLRMCESYLGDKKFRSGIRSYMKKFKNKNAAGHDLWDALAKASKEPVGELMQSWVAQEGFPLVTARTEKRGNDTVLKLSQRRFFASKDLMVNPPPASRSQLWHIPVVVRHDGGTERVLMKSKDLEVKLPANTLWIYPNAGSTGFYRLELDAQLRRDLVQNIGALTPAERMSLVEDQWSLVRNGLIGVDAFMDVLAAFQKDADHIVTRSLAGRLAFLETRLVRDADRPALAGFTRWLLGGQLKDLGWEPGAGEGAPVAVRRATVVDALGDLGRDAAVLAEAERRVESEIADPTKVEPNLAGVLVALAALRGDATRFRRFVDIYLARKKAKAAPELQSRYLNALTCFEDASVIPQLHQLCLDGTIPQEQLRLVLVNMISRRASGRATWDFVKKNWAHLGPRVGSMGVSRLVEATGALPVELKDDVQRFFTENPVDEAKRALAKALEAMTLRKELVARESSRLGEWLARFSPKG
jgi:puromycin-sensitive aminopeptidase